MNILKIGIEIVDITEKEDKIVGFHLCLNNQQKINLICDVKKLIKLKGLIHMIHITLFVSPGNKFILCQKVCRRNTELCKLNDRWFPKCIITNLVRKLFVFVLFFHPFYYFTTLPPK